ncbi:MAG: hypothetical protein OXE84_08715 [Rhodobacteraceae bacterium]|nr:hypothetical protein [Paracoccaceae bacterium]MCY4196751.1 hypothetical protein [Paracoccaceae bacterium]
MLQLTFSAPNWLASAFFPSYGILLGNARIKIPPQQFLLILGSVSMPGVK